MYPLCDSLSLPTAYCGQPGGRQVLTSLVLDSSLKLLFILCSAITVVTATCR